VGAGAGKPAAPTKPAAPASSANRDKLLENR
jgi:hypothetical protein